MTKVEFNFKKNLATLYLISIYFFIYSIYELLYIYDIYSCHRLNLCVDRELSLSYVQIYGLQVIKIVCSLLIFISSTRMWALFMLLIVQCLFMFANKFVHSPEQAYLNFLILVLLYMDWPQSQSEDSKKINTDLFRVFSLIFFISYSYSGFTKFSSSFWMDGTFMIEFFKKNHLVYSSIIYEYTSHSLLRCLTYFVVFIELFSFLSIFNQLLKIFFLMSLTLMQLGLILTTDLWQVCFGMLICHLFVIDYEMFNLLIKPFKVSYCFVKNQLF